MKKFRLKNIKSFINSEEIEIKPITIFVGRNSCGKSSLLRFPVVLAQTFKEDVITPLLLFGNMIDYGNYDDVVNRHSNNSIGFTLEFGEELWFAIRRMMGSYYLRRFKEVGKRYKKVELEVLLSKQKKKIVVDEVKLVFDGEQACLIKREDNEKYYMSINKELIKNSSNKKYEFKLNKLRFERFIPSIDTESIIKNYISTLNINKENEDEILEKIYGILRGYDLGSEKFEINEQYLQDIFDLNRILILIDAYFRGINSSLKSDARELTYIGPFRESPKRTYRDSESNYSDVGVRGENAGMLLRQAAQGDRKLLEDVSNWFSKSMGYDLDIEDVGSSLFSVVVKRESSMVDNIIDTGYGISQVLPIVTQLYNKNGSINFEQRNYLGITEKKIFIFEQPELHLHPAAQAQLADLFVENVIDNRSEKIIIETHSEHLIRKLQVLVANPNINFSNDQVAIYYVDKDINNNSVVQKMEICENGQFEKEWPSGFFDKSYELTKQLLIANRKRKFNKEN